MRTKHIKLHLNNKIINSLKYLLCEILRDLGYNEKLIAKGIIVFFFKVYIKYKGL